MKCCQKDGDSCGALHAGWASGYGFAWYLLKWQGSYFRVVWPVAHPNRVSIVVRKAQKHLDIDNGVVFVDKYFFLQEYYPCKTAWNSFQFFSDYRLLALAFLSLDWSVCIWTEQYFRPKSAGISLHMCCIHFQANLCWVANWLDWVILLW